MKILLLVLVAIGAMLIALPAIATTEGPPTTIEIATIGPPTGATTLAIADLGIAWFPEPAYALFDKAIPLNKTATKPPGTMTAEVVTPETMTTIFATESRGAFAQKTFFA